VRHRTEGDAQGRAHAREYRLEGDRTRQGASVSLPPATSPLVLCRPLSSPLAQTRAAGSRAGEVAARTGKGHEARTSPLKSRQSARPTAQPAAPRNDLEERLTAAETQLAMAVARIETLEGKMTKSLLGLRVTL